jgi:hypothetical protein
MDMRKRMSHVFSAGSPNGSLEMMMWSILTIEARNKMLAKRQAKKLGVDIRS